MFFPRPVIRLVNLKGRIGIFEQLKIEEILMRHDESNWCILNYHVEKPAIVLGISGKVTELVDLDACIRDEITLIRRFSGGGTVIVDNSTLFASFIMNVIVKLDPILSKLSLLRETSLRRIMILNANRIHERSWIGRNKCTHQFLSHFSSTQDERLS